MADRTTLLDGATGTNLWAMAAARGIPHLPVWQYNLTHRSLVRELAGRFAAAGSEILSANTFWVMGFHIMETLFQKHQ